jgi:excisionase family DNA binding protein
MAKRAAREGAAGAADIADAAPAGGSADGAAARASGRAERRARVDALKRELLGGSLLTAAEVAEILDVHPRTVGDYIRDGKLRAFQFGGNWKISENALRAFVNDQTRRCSFCGKEDLQVRRLIAGPNGAFICDGCVARCNEILAREAGSVVDRTSG